MGWLQNALEGCSNAARRSLVHSQCNFITLFHFILVTTAKLLSISNRQLNMRAALEAVADFLSAYGALEESKGALMRLLAV